MIAEEDFSQNQLAYADCDKSVVWLFGIVPKKVENGKFVICVFWTLKVIFKQKRVYLIIEWNINLTW